VADEDAAHRRSGASRQRQAPCGRDRGLARTSSREKPVEFGAHFTPSVRRGNSSSRRDGPLRQEGTHDKVRRGVAREIRPPITAVAGEIDLALRRDRSAEEYRDVLRRIVAPISELVAISGDLSLLSVPGRRSGRTPACGRLDLILARIAARYAENAAVRVDVVAAGLVCVAGDEPRLGRAITLVIDHALRYRRGNACVSIHVLATGGEVRIALRAQPSGFWPHAWESLRRAAASPVDPLRLRRILEDAGGDLILATGSGTDVVHVVLRGTA
jgi:signal transduction histidine kinase